jgi:hypothetical protein
VISFLFAKLYQTESLYFTFQFSVLCQLAALGRQTMSEELVAGLLCGVQMSESRLAES